MSLKAHRAEILQAMTQALDSCIAVSEDHAEISASSPVRFRADIIFSFDRTTATVRSAPELDFTGDLAPQLESKALQLEKKVPIQQQIDKFEGILKKLASDDGV
jgi:hypothetical protein